MSNEKETGAGNGGLLSKVVKFVKSPTTQWSDLDRPEPESSAADSHAALKAMVERKRRNDFVRNREFDMLRKIRRRELPVPDLEAAGPPSYASSIPANLDEREQTLKKIDEIEAQMSRAWFKRKSDGSSTSAPATTGSDATQLIPPSERPDATPAGLAQAAAGGGPAATLSGRTFPPTTPHAPGQTRGFAPTMTMTQLASTETTAPVPPPAGRAAEATGPGTAATTVPPPVAAAALAPAGPSAPPQQERLARDTHDPDIEEAAIRFANGDTEGAEAGLLELLREGGRQRDDIETWLTLFDLYRAAGEQAKFDDAALGFAARFGRSAPQWSTSTEATVQIPLASEPTLAINEGAFHWASPSVLGTQSIAVLKANLARHPPPWRLDWQHLKSVDPTALSALHGVLQSWASAQVPLRFRGGEQLLDVLTEQAPSDDRTIDQGWWLTRLALLRVMGMMDEFEITALNYCVTYEVSPPDWEAPKCIYTRVGEEGLTLPPGEFEIDSTRPSEYATTVPPTGTTSMLDGGVLKVDLKGDILGSADAALKPAAPPQGRSAPLFLEFHCRGLRRVDFGAAGDLLNWATAQQAEGQQISFLQVNRLVAAFFCVIGINEVARITLRRD